MSGTQRNTSFHQRIAEHKNSAIGRHFFEAHGKNQLFERKPIHSFKKVPEQI